MRLERRIRKLEAQFISEPVVLILADGREQEIHGPRYFLLDLFVGACRGDLRQAQAAQIELIQRSVDAIEPGGARMVELLQRLLDGPALESGSGYDVPIAPEPLASVNTQKRPYVIT